MFSRIHNRLGTAGLIVAIVALVAALAGTALAAGGLTGKQKREVTKIAKKFAGKQGPAGPAGANGKDGATGSSGSDGRSIILGTAGSGCVEGGVKVEVEGNAASKQFVCNGAAGAPGEDGACSASDANCILPSGATLTGVWSFNARGKSTIETEVGGVTNTYTAGVASEFFQISFPLRLATPPTFQWVGEGEFTPGVGNCPGRPELPEAKPGFLCVYALEIKNAGKEADHHPTGLEADTADRTSGLVGEFKIEPGEEGYGMGTWAVTAP
jgi:hypothetical protein